MPRLAAWVTDLLSMVVLAARPAKARSGWRTRSSVRRRGNSFRVLVHAERDALTGKDSHLTESMHPVQPVVESGDDRLAKVSARVLEQFWAQLRRRRTRCNGKAYLEHFTDQSHECNRLGRMSLRQTSHLVALPS
ncbi:hypothetical protein [Actinopolymorpha pittospori]|uniref:Uncharacterized protein n=1 Tax=Actinopolymorpha pittospori TaxID=648752 RepID=A0A927MNA8_9ACTN|nr:hypothetical protein [Actinopolymorpha pittospori]MBE1603386.1 hypothetical protein [Actinopolymorpha pittospori]